MRLEKVLDLINQMEKISFLKILDTLCTELPKSTTKIKKILDEGDNNLKNVDNNNIANLFDLLKINYQDHLKGNIKFSDLHLDILVDILIRDGNSIMRKDWFLKLYIRDINKLKLNIRTFSKMLKNEGGEIEPDRKRDYIIYLSCLKTAYENDSLLNREKKLSWEEKSVLHTLARELELSNEEVRWMSYNVLPLKELKIDDIISELKESGMIFFNRKSDTIYVPDEIVWLLREIVGIEIPLKYVRRILRHLKDGEINLISRKHNIDRNLKRSEKIQRCLSQGLSVTNLLTKEIFMVGTPKSARKKRIQILMTTALETELKKQGLSLEDKVSNLILYFNDLEMDETKSITRQGFKQLLGDVRKTFPSIKRRLQIEFELGQKNVMHPDLLDDYNIKPSDVIYLLTKREIKDFCKRFHISNRGNLVTNIINKYRNVEDLYLENFELVGNRDLNALLQKGLIIKESELGQMYEKLTRIAFTHLGFNVDEKLRKHLNTQRAKMDILLNLDNNNVIIVECKTIKDKNYDKYASISRQLKAYEKICKDRGYNVKHVLVVSSKFSDEFVRDCEYDPELNLSLLTSQGIVKLTEGFRASKLKQFPVNLLLKKGQLYEDRILQVIQN